MACNATPGAPASRAFAKPLDELGAQRAARLGIDGAVNGFVADKPWSVHEPKSASNLLRRIAAAQACDDGAPKRSSDVSTQLAPSQAGASSASTLNALAEECKIAPAALNCGSPDFARDCGGTEPQSLGHLALAVAGHEHRVDIDAVYLGEMSVVCSHVQHLSMSKVLHFNSEAIKRPNA